MSPSVKRPKAAMPAGSHARTEGTIPGPGDDDAAGVHVLFGGDEGQAQLADQLGVQGVAGVGPVEAQHGDGAALLTDEDGFAHGAGR